MKILITALILLSHSLSLAQTDDILLPTENSDLEIESEAGNDADPTLEAPNPPDINDLIDSNSTLFEESSSDLDNPTIGNTNSGLTSAAGVLPASAQIGLSVINISQDNSDAQVVGAKPGDILRYEFSIKSETEDIDAYIASVNLNQINQYGEIIDAGLGDIANGEIVFPAFTHQAPCQQIFSFFVRINPCSEQNLTLNATGNDQVTNVPLHCKLAATGISAQWMWWMMATIILMLGVIWFHQSHRIQNRQ